MNNEKLSYEEFKQKVKDEIKSHLPAKYKDYRLKEDIVRKVNKELETLILLRDDPEAKNITYCTATFYYEDYYQKYLLGATFEAIMGEMAAIVNYTDSKGEELVKKHVNFGKCIVFQLINHEKNKKLLEKLPHRDILDLALTYREVKIEDGQFYSAFIDYDLLKTINMTEDELYDFAYETTWNFMEPEIINVIETMHALTNKKFIWGAASIVYGELLEEFANRLGCDLYLLPASLNEMVILPTCLPKDIVNDRTVKEMVRSVNKESITEEEWLSDNAYIYRRAEHCIEMLQ